MKEIKFDYRLLKLKYWPSWLAMLLWWCSANLLPLPLQLYLGHRLGLLLFKLNIRRTRIARVNIEKCFPMLKTDEQERLVKHSLCETGAAIFETGAAWFWPNWRFRGKYELHGRENIDGALIQKKGVIFLGIHFTTIEIGAAIVNLEFPISGFYRPHTNAVYEYVQAKGRTRRNRLSQVIANEDLRGLIRKLRAGAVVNYAPDQDYGRQRSVFAPFFGISTATVKAPKSLSKAGNAQIIPWTTRRSPENNKYFIEVFPPIDEHIEENDIENAAFINAFVEEQIRKNPTQFLWVHRRFKTRPDNEGSFYDVR